MISLLSRKREIMNFKYENKSLEQVVLPVLYPVFEDSLDLIDGLTVKKEAGKITVVPTLGHLKTPTVVFVGLGDRDSLETDSLQAALRKGALAVDGDEFVVALDHLGNIEELIKLCVHAISEALYKYRDKKEVTVSFISQQDVSSLIEEQAVIAESIEHTRDLVNQPSNLLTPLTFESYLKSLASELGVEMTSLDNEALASMGAGGILAVNQGSDLPARLITLKYNGAGNEEYTALVGKGITFDSGGYSLKPANSMKTMKCDMGGAASVIGAFESVVRLKKRVNVFAVVVLTENMVNGSAYKVDDVITMLNKKTVEVTNTDAEGRIVLGDALVHAASLGATRIVDLATLTGACIAALGDEFTGIFSNSEEYYSKFMEASENSHEKLWRLPLSKKVASSLKKSIVADLVNSTGKPPGATVAANFLQEFIAEGIEWVHLDIAGTAFKTTGTVGATGVMVKTLVDVLAN